MKGWLIYKQSDAEDNHSYIDWFIKEAAKQGIQLELIFRESLMIGVVDNKKTVRYQGQTISLPKFAIVRIMEPILNRHLEACGMAVFNNHNISAKANNKIRTHHEVQKLGVPMVDTIYMTYSTELVPPFAFPLIIKEATGSGGKEVFLIENKSEWEKTFATMRSDFLVQRCNVQLGIDIRVFVVGREIVGAIKRENEHDFRANYKLGGSVSWYPLNQMEQAMIHKMIHHFQFGMVGIDFLIGEEGMLLFNEIEDVVGSRSLSKVSNINILEKYVTYIKHSIINHG